MNLSLFSINKYFEVKTIYKSKRDEIISLAVNDINKLREGSRYVPITKRLLAIKLNKNPFLSKDTTALEELYQECHSKMDYRKLWWLLKNK